MRPVRARLAVLACLAAVALAAPSALCTRSDAQDAKKGDAQDAKADDEPILVGQERFDCQEPPFRLERPSDSWQFLDLAVLERKAREAHQDTSGYQALKARLWQGATRANIYVYVQPDLVNRAAPPEPAELGQPIAQGLVAALLDGKLEQEGAVRVGSRAGWTFEVHGRPHEPANAPPIAVLGTVVYRPEDHQIFKLTLECPEAELGRLKRDYAKLLRKARL
jgi:hypothetical protein